MSRPHSPLQMGPRVFMRVTLIPMHNRPINSNYGVNVDGDITARDAKDIPEHDLLLAGFPCQAFSIIGKQKGFQDKTRGTLFFDIRRILKHHSPSLFLLENVKQLSSHDKGRTIAIIDKSLAEPRLLYR